MGWFSQFEDGWVACPACGNPNRLHKNPRRRICIRCLSIGLWGLGVPMAAETFKDGGSEGQQMLALVLMAVLGAAAGHAYALSRRGQAGP